jgi:hypothetical protein
MKNLLKNWKPINHNEIFYFILLIFCLILISCSNKETEQPTDNNHVSYIKTDGFGCNSDGRSQLYMGKLVGWGDLHSHTSYSYDAVEKELCDATPMDALIFARDESNLDFVAITDHAENISPGKYSQEKWDSTIAQEIEFSNNNSRPVVFPGFEYTKNQRKPGTGHKNIICYDFEHLPQRGYGSDVYEFPDQLWNYLNTTPAKNYYISIPHHPAKGNDYDNPVIPMNTDWDVPYVNYDVQPLVEIYSRHGSSESYLCNDEKVNGFKDECSVDSVLSRWLLTKKPEYKLGIIGSTDTHFGKPGDTREVMNNVDDRLGYWTGGLAGVWVDNMSRENIWNSLKKKNCYGTSGSRILLEFTAKIGNEVVPMGGSIYLDYNLNTEYYAEVNLHIFAKNDDLTNFTRVQIFRNGSIIMDSTNTLWLNSVHIDYKDKLTVGYAIYRVKVWQKSNNNLPNNVAFERAWSSPIWIQQPMSSK